jgi:uncharacterized membrane protein YoaK (UPF0700 family)
MVKIAIGFISIFLIFFFGIDIFRMLTKKEKISLTKWLGYSTLCSLLAIGAITLIVLLF